MRDLRAIMGHLLKKKTKNFQKSLAAFKAVAKLPARQVVETKKFSESDSRKSSGNRKK